MNTYEKNVGKFWKEISNLNYFVKLLTTLEQKGLNQTHQITNLILYSVSV